MTTKKLSTASSAIVVSGPANVPLTASLPPTSTGGGVHFIMSHRRAGRFGADAQKRSRASLETAFAKYFSATTEIVSEKDSGDEVSRKTLHLKMEPDEARIKYLELPADVLLEPLIPHYPAWTMPLMFRWLAAKTTSQSFPEPPLPWTMPLSPAYPQWTMPLAPATPDWTMPLRGNVHRHHPLAGSGKKLRVKVASGAKPLQEVNVILFMRGPGGVSVELRAITDGSGFATFNFGPHLRALAMFVDPHGSYWPLIVRGPVDGQTFELQPLPAKGPLDWWHEACGVRGFNGPQGSGIRVGVVDTGCGPHPHLNHCVNIGSFINGSFDANGGNDVDRHGTHVTGIIGARALKTKGFSGMAPNAELFSARVFPDPQTGANQGDIADAIDALSRNHSVDLINLSLGSATGSQIERDAIQDALERGTLCICAAGNDGTTPMSYPARFPECVAVSALGRDGWGCSGSPTAANYPNEPDKYGDSNLFLAEFSNYGQEIACAAPGNGIISTVPYRAEFDNSYAALDGTSMAAPMATGVLGRILSGNSEYLALDRNALRAQKAREILRASCRDLGLAAHYQGRGCPQA